MSPAAKAFWTYMVVLVIGAWLSRCIKQANVADVVSQKRDSERIDIALGWSLFTVFPAILIWWIWS